MYVALEGIDTAGKSTQVELLKQRYPDAIFTCEPGGSVLGKRLRKILLEEEISLSPQAECLLFLSDRAEHLHRVILPNLGQMIISDRSLISGIAYAKEFSFEELFALNAFATQGIYPDCVVLLELYEDELKRRLKLKHQDKIEQRGIAFLLEIQKRMIGACSALGIALVRIDASTPKEEIHQKICALL